MNTGKTLFAQLMDYLPWSTFDRIVETSREQGPRGDDHMEDEEKVLAGRPDANMPALLTKDVPGG